MKRRCMLSGIVCLLVIAGCSFYHAKTILRVAVFAGSNWDVPEADSYQLLDEAFASFEKKHPNVDVQYVSGTPRDTYEESISQMILEDDLPDVLFVPSELFSTLCNNQVLQPLDTFAQTDASFSIDAYYDASLQSAMFNDTLYALPYLSVPELMFVNKTLLNEAGYDVPDESWTWDDFYQIVKGVTKDTNADGQLDQYGVCGYQWKQAAYTNNVEFYDERKNMVYLSSKGMIETVQYLREIYRVCDQNEVTSQMFDEGLVAFQPMNYSDYRTYMPYPWRVKKFSGFEWECLPFPSGENGDNVSAIDTLMVAMSSHSTKKDLAWELMCDLSCDEDYQKKAAVQLPAVSVLPKVMKDPQVNQDLQQDIPGTSQFDMNVLDTVMQKGRSVRTTQDYEQIMQNADSTINDLCHNQQDIENELIRLDQNINSILKK